MLTGERAAELLRDPVSLGYTIRDLRIRARFNAGFDGFPGGDSLRDLEELYAALPPELRTYADLGLTLGERYGVIDFTTPGIARERAEGRAAAMGFLDTLIGGVQQIGGAILSGAGAVIQAAPVIIGAAQAIQATQAVLNGSAVPAPTAAVMPAAMAAGMMAASGGSATQGSAEQAAFAAACRTDPSCTAAIWAALQGGNVTPAMMNGSDISEASLAAAGIPPALIMALRGGGQSALNALRQLVPGLAVGAVGAAAGSALVELSGGTGSSGQRFPRALFVPDPRGGVREYKYRGRPVLYSGDIAAARRVVKIAKRAKSARGGRRPASKAAQIMMLPAGSAVACGKCGTGACSGC